MKIDQFKIDQNGKFVKVLATNLEWKVEAEDECSFNQAITRYSKADHDDWRLPSLSELKTLLNEEWPHAVLADHGDMFWSSDQVNSDHSKAHYIEFNGGFSNTTDKSTYGCVRLVRSAMN